VYRYVDSNDISNSISMARAGFDGTVLLVEGVTDYRLYGKFSDKEDCMIVVAHSKDNALASVRKSYHERGDRGVMAIVDSDLDTMLGVSRKPPAFATDTRDLETMLIKSESLDEVLQEYCDPVKRHAFEAKYGKIRDAVGNAAYPIGLLMYISERDCLELSFRDLDFNAFINPIDLSCDVDMMIDEVLYSSGKPPSVAKKIRRLLDKEMSKGVKDPWVVCRGHDAVEVLLIGLRKTFGGFNAKQLEHGSLGGALRIAFDTHDFKKHRLYEDTDRWSRERGLALWAF